MTLPFALGIGAQVGFLVHQLAFLQPKIGLQTASYAVAVTTVMAVLGRLVVGAVIDRLNQRIVSAVSFVSQAARAVRADQHRRARRRSFLPARCSASRSAT